MPHNMRAVQLSDFAEEEEHIGWLVEGLLPDTGWTLLYGAEGVGKTRFALQMMDAIQEGQDFLNMKTQRAKGLFIQADSSTKEWREMVRLTTPDNHAIGIVNVPDYVFDTPQYVEWIRKAVVAIKPGFAVLDSLYKLTSDDINSPKITVKLNMMRAVLGEIPFVLLHHPPQGMNRGAGSRAIAATASYNWELTETTLRIVKGRLTAKASIAISFDEHGRWVSIQDEVDAFADIDMKPMKSVRR
jgi:RecA-family ATPase